MTVSKVFFLKRQLPVEALVDFEPVAPVPVAALLDERLGLVDVARDQVVIDVEQADADVVEDDVESVAQRHCLVVRLAEGRQRRLFAAHPAQVLRLLQVRLSHLQCNQDNIYI